MKPPVPFSHRSGYRTRKPRQLRSEQIDQASSQFIIGSIGVGMDGGDAGALGAGAASPAASAIEQLQGQLRPGIALSAAQVAQLTSDIIWLETQTVTLPDGSTQQALVPRVYLLPRAGDLAPTGALIAAREVQIQLDGTLHNSGTIAGRKIVQIDAQNLYNSGLIGSDGTTLLKAQEDIVIEGGQVSARDALRLSAGRDITVASTTRSSQHTAAPLAAERGGSLAGLLVKQREPQPGSQSERTTLDRVASLHVTGEAGTLLAQAGRDVTLQAAVIGNTGSGATTLLAGRDLNLSTVTTGSTDDIRWDASNRLRMDRREETGTHITAGGEVVLRGGQDITARAVDIKADGNLSAVAGRNVIIEAGEANLELDEAHRTKSRSPISSKTTTTKITHRSAKAQGSQLQGQRVELLGTNVVSVGTHIQGQDSVHIEGSDQTLLYAAQDRSFTQVDVSSKRSSVVGPKYRKTESTDILVSNVGIGTELISSEAVRIGVGERTELIGARVQAPTIEFVRSENTAPGAAGELLQHRQGGLRRTGKQSSFRSARWKGQKKAGTTAKRLWGPAHSCKKMSGPRHRSAALPKLVLPTSRSWISLKH